MSSFVAADGTPLFVDGTGGVDVSKAASSKIFDKGFVHNVGTGAKTLGARSSASRLNEPAWNVSGGAIRIVRIVPAPGAPGTLFRYTMVMRVSDEGVIEVIRVKHELTYDSATQSFEWSSPELTVMQKSGVYEHAIPNRNDPSSAAHRSAIARSMVLHMQRTGS
jgi:hypothetical protein